MLIYIKKIFLVFLLSFSFVFFSNALDENDISAKSAVVIDADNGEIIFQKSPFEKRSMASTTKIMTSVLAVESGKLKFPVTAKEKIYIEGTAIGIDAGDCMPLETLVYAMLLESGNDAALLTAQYLAGSEKNFSVLMNEKAHKLGMTKTNFVTASGLDDENHYTTAYDMAILGAYAIKNPVFRQITSSKSYKAEFIKPDIKRTFYNHNRLLNECEGVFGIKTGFTKKSGRCLVSACEREGKTLVAVTLYAPDDWNDHKKLYNYAYSLFDKQETSVKLPDTVKVYSGEKASVSLEYELPESISKKVGTEYKCKIYLNSFYYAPLKKGDILGKIIYYDGEKQALTVNITCDENIKLTETFKSSKPDFRQRAITYIKNLFKRGK